MNQRTAIQKTLAIFLILVFTLGTAPKAWFHDLLADHKDQSDCGQIHHSAVLHHERPNCHFDDLVVSAPFLSVSDVPALPVSLHFTREQAEFYCSSEQSLSQHKESRGPPSIVELKSAI